MRRKNLFRFILTVSFIMTASICSYSQTASGDTNSQGPTANLTNLALGRPVESNNHIYEFIAKNAVDGNVNTYWEGAANAYPNIITVDLCTEKNTLKFLKIKLNPKRIWQARTMTFSILKSDNGKDFTTIAESAVYKLDPVQNGNSLLIPIESASRYIRLNFTANSSATAGQIGELEIYGE